MTFALHPRLAADTLPVGDLGLCLVRLMDDTRFPWLVLVPRRPDLVELFDLTASERAQLMEEIAAVAQGLAGATNALKMNVGALGNLVPQLHLHVVSRRNDDAAWPGPVWGFGHASPYDRAEAAAFIETLSAAIAFH